MATSVSRSRSFLNLMIRGGRRRMTGLESHNSNGGVISDFVDSRRRQLSLNAFLNHDYYEVGDVIAAVKRFRGGGGGGVKVFGGLSTLSFHTGRNLLVSSDNNNNMKCGVCLHAYERNVEDFVKLVRCPKCGALQKLEAQELPNYFQILKQVKGFKVDLNAIANKTKELQKIFHPDLYGGKGEGQQDLSQEYSSLVNKALSTLTNPIERGRYLLSLEGISLSDAAQDLEKSTNSDMQFLQEIMLLNEELEDLGSVDDWKSFKQRNDQQMQNVQKELQTAFEIENLEKAHLLLGKLKFYETLNNKLKERQSALEIVE